MSKSKVYGYCRVSKKDNQDIGKYRQQLLDSGVDENDIYQDYISGIKREREGLNELLSVVKFGDTLLVPDITRIARSTIDLINIVEDLKNKGIYIKSLKETWLNTEGDNAQSTLLLTVFAGLAQYERDLISLRTKETLAYKKVLNGGKSINGRPSKSNETKSRIIKMYNQGTWSIQEIQEATSCSRNTVYKYIREGRTNGKIK